MQRCATCQAEIPEHAQFCGHCGQLTSGSLYTIVEDVSGAVTSSYYDRPTAISQVPTNEQIYRQSYPLPAGGTSDPVHQVAITPEEWQRMARGDVPLSNTTIAQPFSNEDEEERRRRGLLLGGAVLGMGAAGLASLPVTPQPPAMAGIPHIGNVPFTQGVPLAQGPQPAPVTAPPSASPAPVPQVLTRAQKHVRPRGVHHAIKSKLVGGVATKWVAIVVTTIVVVTTAGIGATLATPPGLSSPGLHSNGHVAPGETLTLNGQGFLPGGHVTLRREDGRILHLLPHPLPQHADSGGAHGDHVAAQVDVLADSVAVTTEAAGTAAPDVVSVDAVGSFAATVVIDRDWTPGPHTIIASEDMLSRSAKLSLTIDAVPATLTITPETLDCGQLAKGMKVAVSLTITNNGDADLQWQLNTGSAHWLTANSTQGVLHRHADPQSVYVTCDTATLSPGTQTATLQLTSNGGQRDIPVKIQVLPASAVPDAKLTTSSAQLDFGTVQMGQQASMSFLVNNVGKKALTWNIPPLSAAWASADTTEGTINPADNPQQVTVSVDTTNLAAGNYSAIIGIQSNGGNIQIPISLVVFDPATPTPTDTVTPTPSPVVTPTPSPVVTPTPTPPPVVTPTPTIAPPAICNVPATVNLGTVQQAQGATSSSSISFGNCGGQVMNWTAQNDSAGWLTQSSSSGQTKPTQTSTISITGNASSLKPGSYQANVTINSDGGVPQNVQVTFQVTAPPAPPQLCNVTSSVGFPNVTSGSGDGKVVGIYNCGGSTLNWTATTDSGSAGWLSITTSGSVAPGTGSYSSMFVNVSAATLAPGTYTGYIYITSNGGNWTITVTMTVVSPPIT